MALKKSGPEQYGLLIEQEYEKREGGQVVPYVFGALYRETSEGCWKIPRLIP